VTTLARRGTMTKGVAVVAFSGISTTYLLHVQTGGHRLQAETSIAIHERRRYHASRTGDDRRHMPSADEQGPARRAYCRLPPGVEPRGMLGGHGIPYGPAQPSPAQHIKKTSPSDSPYQPTTDNVLFYLKRLTLRLR
jgi:hypothetical protein